MKKTTVAGLLILWFVVLMIACGRDLIGPIGREALPETPESALTSTAPQHDPRAFVFEDLGPPEEVIESLDMRTCVIHYRRYNGKYTPVPFVLREFSAEARQSANGNAAIIYRLDRYDRLAVRAVCNIPNSQAALEEARIQLRTRVRLPGAIRTMSRGSIPARIDPSGGTMKTIRTFWSCSILRTCHV